MKCGLAVLVLTGSALFAAKPGDSALDATRYLNHIKYLASPDMRGRETGSPELEKAAKYIASQFQADGLKSVGNKGYLQPFQVTTTAKLGAGNQLAFTAGAGSRTLIASKDFIPFNFSSKGKVANDVVFAGYGITAPEYNYDDYADVDVKGKVVLVLAHEPQEYDEKSVFEGKVYTDHAQFYSKAANARKHGAVAVVVVSDRINHKGTAEELEIFGRTTGPADAGILFIQMKHEIAESWLKAAGKDLAAIEKGIETDLKPRSLALKGVQVRANIDVERAVKTAHNVFAYLPGETDEYLIIGAHYDHLGLGYQFSLAPSLAGTVHPGADDNGSGTAGVLELAHRFANLPKQKRGILFMTFAGEEQGLLGSGFYANHPEFPVEKAVAMINMDMIGRVNNGKIFIGGAGTGDTLRRKLDVLIPQFPDMKIDYSDSGGYGSSDHTSFTAKQIPVLFFFSGLHSDYHKPGDTWDKINSKGAVRVLELVAKVADDLEFDQGRPAFVRVIEKQENPHSGSSSAGSTSLDSTGGGYGPWFGSIPDFGEVPRGVKFADVTPGSPAFVAGLKAEDVLIQFGKEAIQNLYDFTYALRATKVGDEVDVEVLRNGRSVKVKVKLTERH